MSKNGLALLLAGAFMLVSVAWMTYLSTERADATKQTAMPLDVTTAEGTRTQSTASDSPTQPAPRSFVEQVSSSQRSRQAGLSKVATSALIGGAFGAGAGVIVEGKARGDIMTGPMATGRKSIDGTMAD